MKIDSLACLPAYLTGIAPVALLVGTLVLAPAPPAGAQTLYVSSGASSGVIGKYDAASGNGINASFITGLYYTRGMAVSGNNLYVLDYGNSSHVDYGAPTNDTIHKYNATTGQVIAASFLTSFPYGINQMMVSGNDLYLIHGYSYSGYSNNPKGVLAKYDATTGQLLNTLATGLDGASGLALSGNKLYVSDYYGKTVNVFDATTGQGQPTLATGLDGPGSLAVSGNTLYVSTNSAVIAYDTITGETVDAFLGQTMHVGIAANISVFGGDLYIAGNHGRSTIEKYDAATGQTIDGALLTGLYYPHVAVAAVPEPGSYARLAGLLALGVLLLRNPRVRAWRSFKSRLKWDG